MTLKDFYQKICELYPENTAAVWDNDGIMVSGDTCAEVKRVLVALDPTIEVIEYAAKNSFDTVLTHHPMIFKPQKNVTFDGYCGKRIITALKNGISVISLHTRLDRGAGGVNDTLLKTMGFECAGVFGDDEIPGIGRYAETAPMSALELGKIIKEKLGCEMVRFTGDPDKIISRFGVCGGAGGDFLTACVKNGFDAYITGECSYNKAQDITESGLVTYEIGHYHSESPVCGMLVYLAESIAGAETEFYDSCAYRML